MLDKIAIISDVHGNKVALETALHDIRGRGINLIYNLGDLIGKGARSDLVVDRCREVCQVIVRGNWDDALIKEDDDPEANWYRQQLGKERLAYLDSLPAVHDFWLSGKRIRLYHASEESVYKRVQPWHPPEVHRAMFNNTLFTGLDCPEPDVVGYGDIHAAFMLPLPDDPKVLFNTGSVGNLA
ncbi:MAG: metallophosphoesterase family protein [Anaerolineae bacterium]